MVERQGGAVQFTFGLICDTKNNTCKSRRDYCLPKFITKNFLSIFFILLSLILKFAFEKKQLQ